MQRNFAALIILLTGGGRFCSNGSGAWPEQDTRRTPGPAHLQFSRVLERRTTDHHGMVP